ncbi:zinc-dependent metalloprotease [Sphingomonas tabacisoli]|uniref:Zinc-dependent metalloprotease n=1 Tax=Sphingomonas tabacisoli TaxID=2249466 RepID=A0ABW4I4Y6_9SPHN
MTVRIAALFLISTTFATPALALDPPAKVLEGTTAQTGLIPLHVDRKGGRILASLPAPDAEGVSGRFIYTASLETGLGSAPLGLDYALNSGSRLLVFRRVGKKVVAEIENPRFRAEGAGPQEQAGVRRSFATSTIWMGDVAAENADGSFLVDLSGFVARDDLGIARALKEQDSTDYRLVPELSVADPNAARVFPKNVELAARLTFTTTKPGPEVDNIAPATGNVTFTVRHSLIALPEPGYVPRRFDPRAGSFGTQVIDFNAPLGSQVVYELANRFRLEKTDPNAARSPVKKPIVFYIDPAAPEPIRTALREGVAWWRDAFDAAGLVDAFRAEILPAGADPLDIRYNVVTWVNRATRGWSYGQPITDPRTGEIIKGQVLLGSLRVRQDMMIYQALVGAGLTGTGDPNDPITAALARIRQLGAHEVGHALGFAHNFAASIGGRQSVMDYPAPRVRLVDGKPDLTDAYGVGIGTWDKFAVAWLYGARTDADAQPVMAAGLAEGLRYVPDQDARASDTAHPLGSLWDDGSDPVAELRRVMEVRRAAIARFGPAALKVGDPQSQLRRAFVPVWLLHRYQVEAASKLLGGVDFHYAVTGDGTGEAKPVAPDRQRAALDVLLDTLSPEALAVPAQLLPNLSVGWSGDDDRQTDIEVMRTAGGPVFDPLAATETAAAVTLTDLLAPTRLNRLEIQSQADPASPSAHEVIDRLIDRSFAFPRDPGAAGVQRRIATTTVLALARTQRDGALSPTIALALSERLNRLGQSLAKAGGSGVQADWSRGLGRLLLDREALTAALADQRRLPKVPPGMPIGD